MTAADEAGVLFDEPPRVPTPVTRPDGRVYRPRKLPTAQLLTHEDGPVEGVAVMRTHSVRTAEDLARAELGRYDPPAEEWVLTLRSTTWGHWRPDGPDRITWAADPTGRTGTPAVFFDAEQR